MQLKARGRSPDTRYAYGADLRRFAEDFTSRIGHAPVVGEVSRKDVETYLYELAERGLAAKTRHRALCAMRTFFKYCAERGLIPENPTDAIPTVTVPKTLPHYLDAPEVEMFLTRCQDPQVKAIAATLYYTGLRIGELCSLRLNDIDLRQGTLRVENGKGSKDRAIPLSRRSRDNLKWYMTRVRPESDAAYVFIGLRRERLTRHWAGVLIRNEARGRGWASSP